MEKMSIYRWLKLNVFIFIIPLEEERLHVRLSPCRASLWILPLYFTHLWKIRAPLHHIEGFNMQHFDQIIDKVR